METLVDLMCLGSSSVAVHFLLHLDVVACAFTREEFQASLS